MDDGDDLAFRAGTCDTLASVSFSTSMPVSTVSVWARMASMPSSLS